MNEKDEILNGSDETPVIETKEQESKSAVAPKAVHVVKKPAGKNGGKLPKKMVQRIVACTLGVVTVASSAIVLVQCMGKKEKDSIVIMTEELSGLFNPFYATSGADMGVVGLTQISMLSTDKDGNLVAGDDQPTVVKDWDYKVIGTGDNQQTVYTYVLKNGLKFSDGMPITMNDVMFNLYEYLDPVYTGSSTMYSIDIVGLKEYRTKEYYADDAAGDQAASSTTNQANTYAQVRLETLGFLFSDIKEETENTTVTDAEMRAAIAEYDFSSLPTYKQAVATAKEREEAAESADENAFYRQFLLADYELALKTFKKELQADFKAAKESYDLTTMPYSEHKSLLENDIFKFFLYERQITPVYAKKPNSSRDDKMKINSFENTQLVDRYNTEEKAIQYIYDITTKGSFDGIVSGWGTAGTLRTQFAAEALDIILHDRFDNLDEAEKEQFNNIKGIVSLGHTTTEASVKVGNNTYTVAHDYNADGTVKNSGEYAVLQITINGTDPKAQYNFGFTVAPAHYYGSANGTGTDVEIDIKNNKFGVPWSDSDFQSKVIQSQRNVEIPVGGGSFKATNASNSDTPTGQDFWSSNIVYFKKNDNFMFDVKAEKLRLQVVSPSNAIEKLKKGEVDYITPQFTKTNSDTLTGMKKDGFEQMSAWSLGYGYIGINAGLISDINIRKAIMSAMDVQIASQYYAAGTCIPISWPMSKVSWAYPKAVEADVTSEDDVNPYDYMRWEGYEEAVAKVKYYMGLANGGAGVSEGDDALNIKFTIAGASITEHPTYEVFKKAATILNEECGWNVEVKADSQALTKLATGSLQVWAAAWGSTIDPDMYQVYHKDSTASSVLAWGYREIRADEIKYETEMGIITELSKTIDAGRKILDKELRKPIYKTALEQVCSLAVEMPVYQRKTLYAYNSKAVTGFSSEVNSYSSPLDKIWELELVK